MEPIGTDASSYESINDAYRHRNVIDYEDLLNKPQIESNTLIGDKTFSDLDLTPLTNHEIDDITTSP